MTSRYPEDIRNDFRQHDDSSEGKDNGLRILIVLFLISVCSLASLLYVNKGKVDGLPFDFSFLFPEHQSPFEVSGIHLGDSLKRVREVRTDLAFWVDSTGGLRARFETAGGQVGLRFANDAGIPRVSHLRLDKVYAGRRGGEEVLLSDLGQAYGKPATSTCETSLALDRKACTFKWLLEEAVAIEARLARDRGEATAASPIQMTLTVTDGLLDRLPMASIGELLAAELAVGAGKHLSSN